MEKIHRASVARIDAELPAPKLITSANVTTMQRPVAKIVPTLAATMVGEERAGAISRAGHYRWPQATMRVMGATKRQVYNTELLTVTTRQNDRGHQRKESKQTDEDTSGTKPVFPNIPGSGTQGFEEKENHSRSPQPRLTSPTKFTQFPRFQRGPTTANVVKLDKQDQTTKLVRNIKFWRGTTPAARRIETQLDTAAQLILHTEQTNEDSLQSWTEQVNTLEETSNHKYFSWHMALRERMMKHEKLHYDEAVTRINKYRERLRKRPDFPSHNEVRLTKDNQLIKNILQSKEDSKSRAAERSFTSGVRMSPSKQWKPYIGSEEGENGLKKPPFFGKSAATANEAAKKQFKQNNNLSSPSTARKHRYSTEKENSASNYPVHGEGLLKELSLEKENVLPSIETTSPPLIDKKTASQDENIEVEKVDEDESKAETRALLVDLKRQLKSGEATCESSITKMAERGNTAPTMQTRTGMGAKLRLLLQSSSQSPRNHEKDGRKSSSTEKRKLHSQNARLRPLTRPHTYGSGTLPKITTIAASSLWKNQQGDVEQVKHRLTLKGIASRKSYTPGRIGGANYKGKNMKEIEQFEEIKPTDQPEKSMEIDQTLKEKTEVVARESITAGKEAHTRGWKGGIVVHKLQTQNSQPSAPKPTATSALLAKSYKFDPRQNPQHMSLKLISSQPHPLHDQMDASKHKSKGKKNTTTQHKLLRISVVEPPLTARERDRRQQELERSNKRLTFNPTHAAVSSFSAAILNSELALRAPSSSPVDMVYKHYSKPNDQLTTSDLWAMRKAAAEQLQNLPADQVPLVEALLQNHTEQLLINSTDGLYPPNHDNDKSMIDSLFESINKQHPTAPKVKDLVDLQRLYHVMKKHGEAYTNSGTNYVYSNSPTKMGPDVIGRSQVMKQHTHQQNLHKTPFYYYPYHNGEQEGRAPLYLVTGVNSLVAKHKQGGTQNHRGSHTQQVRKKQRPEKVQVPVQPHIAPFHHVLKYEPKELYHRKLHDKDNHISNNRLSGMSANRITVMMPKTSGLMNAPVPVTHLEQINEH